MCVIEIAVLLNSAYFPGRKYLPIDRKFNKELNFGLVDFTISFWIKTKSAGTIIAKTGNRAGFDTNMKIIYVEGGVLKVRLGRPMKISRKRVNDNRWHHCALVVAAARPPST